MISKQESRHEPHAAGPRAADSHLYGDVRAQEGDQAADRRQEEGGELRTEVPQGGQAVHALQRHAASGRVGV